jgi:hypothetical protein
MSLFDRLTEAGEDTRWKDTKNDARQHSDRSKKGKRNSGGGGAYVGKNRRYPIDDRATAAGSLRQAYDRDPSVGKKLAKAIKAKKSLRMCPTILPECPDKRDHGKGGPPEHKTACKGSKCDLPSDHGKKYPWPFTHKPAKPAWDKKWSQLSQEDPSLGFQRRPLLTLGEAMWSPSRTAYEGARTDAHLAKNRLKYAQKKGDPAMISKAQQELDAAKAKVAQFKKVAQAEARAAKKAASGGTAPLSKIIADVNKKNAPPGGWADADKV